LSNYTAWRPTCQGVFYDGLEVAGGELADLAGGGAVLGVDLLAAFPGPLDGFAYDASSIKTFRVRRAGDDSAALSDDVGEVAGVALAEHGDGHVAVGPLLAVEVDVGVAEVHEVLLQLDADPAEAVVGGDDASEGHAAKGVCDEAAGLPEPFGEAVEDDPLDQALGELGRVLVGRLFLGDGPEEALEDLRAAFDDHVAPSVVVAAVPITHPCTSLSLNPRCTTRPSFRSARRL